MSIYQRIHAPLAFLVSLQWAVWAAAEEPPPMADPASREHHQLAAAYSAEHRGISLLVMIDGQIVFEDYPNRGRADRAHELASGTKSFSGVMAACAVQDGLLTWDEKAADTITEWKDDPQKNQITVRQLLNLTSGLQTGGERGRVPTYADANPKPMSFDPGARFVYGAVHYQAFGELMLRKLADKNEGPLDYLQRRVFEPIGLNYGSWRKGADGNPHLPSGAALTDREWAKFGEMVRLGGTWEGKEIVKQELLDECFKASAKNKAYGLTWWLPSAGSTRLEMFAPQVRRPLERLKTARDEPAEGSGEFKIASDLVMAAGAGDQRLYVCRSLKLVVARQATGILEALSGRESGWSDKEFLARLLVGKDSSGKEL